MEDKLTVWISGEVKLNFNQQFKLTQKEYDYLMSHECSWDNISEITREGKLDKTWDIIMDKFDIDNADAEELEIYDIELEEND